MLNLGEAEPIDELINKFRALITGEDEADRNLRNHLPDDLSQISDERENSSLIMQGSIEAPQRRTVAR